MPDWRDLPHQEVTVSGEELMRAAAPVLERLAPTISGSKVAVALTDANATVLQRMVGDPALRDVLDHLSLAPGFSYSEQAVGTNACGTSLVERRPCLVVGPEHFAERLRPYACAAAPIRDLVSGRIEGSIDITLPQADATPQMEAQVTTLSHEIEERLLARYTRREQELLAAYGSSGPGPAPGLGADSELDADDRLRLREQAAELISQPRETGLQVPLSRERRATLRPLPVHGSRGTAGTAVEVDVPRPRTRSPGSAGGREPKPRPKTPYPAPDVAAAPRTADDGDRDRDRDPTERWLLLLGEQSVGRLAVAARERLRLLYEAGLSIGTTLDVRTTAEELAEVAIPYLADYVTVDLPDAVLEGVEPTRSDAHLRRVAVAAVQRDCPIREVGELVRYIPASPHSRAYLGNEPVLEPDLKKAVGWQAQRPLLARKILEHGVHSMMCVPLRARGVVLGVATFYRYDRPGPFEDDDLALAEDFVARAAVCIDNARRYTREHATALALQHSLLPHSLPGNSAVEAAHSYRPAQGAVGGDWFDVIPLSGARVALVVGDVVGHGLHATATMGRLRTAVHNFAALELAPDEVLARLDDLVNRLDEDVSEGWGCGNGVVGATCLYAVYDPASRMCSLARAGHPLPAVVRPDGTVGFADVPAGPPLGLGGFPFETVDLELPEGTSLVLFTDGLFERRDRDPDAGLDALCRSLSAARGRPPAATCGAVMEDMLPESCDPCDDVALLVARTRALGPDRIAEWDVPPDPAAVAWLRAAAVEQLTKWGLAEMAFTTEVVLSELVTNAMRHATGPFRLRLLRDRALICEVYDGSSTAPRLRRSGVADEGGRGLFLVAQLTQRWGTRHDCAGKVIWAEQSLPPTAA
jgi:hypothetical protein